jgi:uncharacterized protein YaiL (DUF2058 family)
MGESLQDQLRALGLANQQKDARKGHKEPDKSGKQRPERRPAGEPASEMSLDQAWALRDQEEQRRAQEARSRKQEEDRRRRALNERVRALIDAHRLNRDDAEIPRNFMFRGRIRKIYVTPEQQAALTAGKLGIAYLAGTYHVLASDHLAAVRSISPEHVVERDAGCESEEEFPVPDDLQW